MIAWILGIIALMLALFPIWWMFNIVFSPAGIPIAINPGYTLPHSPMVSRTLAGARESNFFRAYTNSLLYCFFSIVGTLVLCSMAAYEFALFEFPGKKIIFAVILLSLMVPAAVTFIPTYLFVAAWAGSIRCMDCLCPG